jgi:hypothetical protein
MNGREGRIHGLYTIFNGFLSSNLITYLQSWFENSARERYIKPKSKAAGALLWLHKGWCGVTVSSTIKEMIHT